MLDFKEKIKIFISILNEEERSYTDSFNGEILLFSQNHDFKFLKKVDSKNDIKEWIEKLKSRIVMKEDEGLIEDIIDDYILCG